MTTHFTSIHQYGAGSLGSLQGFQCQALSLDRVHSKLLGVTINTLKKQSTLKQTGALNNSKNSATSAVRYSWH